MAEKRNQRTRKIDSAKHVLSEKKRANEKQRDFGKASRRPPEKKQPVCRFSKACGGCDFIENDYTFSLDRKMSEAKLLLSKFKKVNPIIGMDDSFHYRNKISAAVGFEKGRIIAGIYEKNSHRIIDIENCLIEDSEASKVLITLKKLLTSFKMKAHNEDTGYGLIRHILIRVGRSTGQLMVVIVTASPIFPSKKNFVKELLKLHPNISTIVQNINPREDSMVLGERDVTLYGKGYIEDILCGVTFRISPQSFYQINALQTEKLYSYAIESAKLDSSVTVLDTYCGIGTIGLIAARNAKEVIGVEMNKSAVRDASINAKINGIENIRFFEQDATKFMSEVIQGSIRFDVVFMDPPRSGSTTAFLTALQAMAPKRIVYISCNPTTLARDLEDFLKLTKEYRVTKIQPFDCFCYTKHLECVVLLTKVESD